MTSESIIFAGVAIYMVLMLALGYVASRKTHTITEFVVAGRGLPVWLCSMTVIATWFGGSTVMGSSGAAYDDGFLGVIEDPFGAALALFLVGFFFARMFRRLRIMTVADFMEQRYGRAAAIAITVTALFSNIMWVGGMLVAFGTIFEALAGVPLMIGIVSGAIVIFVYTAIGGMWAVALTDFVQMLIILVGLLILFVVVLIDVGGWGAIATRLPEGTFRMIPFERSGEEWANYPRAWMIFGVVDISSQALMQRVAAAKSERVAQTSFYLGSIGYLVFGMIPVLLGIIATVTMPDLSYGESVVPQLALEHLHPVAIAVFVGAVLAAIMSSADSALLACSSLLARNVLPMLREDASDRQALLVARLAIPACGIVAVFIALEFQKIFQLAVDSNMLGLAAIIVPFIMGVWWKKANRIGALSAMGAGVFAWLFTLFTAPRLPSDFIGLGACFVTMIVVTLLTQRIDPPRELRDCDGKPVDTRHRLGLLSPFGRD
jgi:SSS family transporter